MTGNTLQEIQDILNLRSEKRRRKKITRMKVSGRKVKALQRLIIERAKKRPPTLS